MEWYQWTFVAGCAFLALAKVAISDIGTIKYARDASGVFTGAFISMFAASIIGWMASTIN